MVKWYITILDWSPIFLNNFDFVISLSFYRIIRQLFVIQINNCISLSFSIHLNSKIEILKSSPLAFSKIHKFDI